MVLSEEKEKELERLAKRKDFKKLNESVLDVHPYDLSEFLHKLKPELRNSILSNLRDEVLIGLIPELPEETQL